MKRVCIIFMLVFFALNIQAADWPIFKGNIYFTGNNDEIIVKNNNLKWLFQAEDRVFNPVASDGKIYFVDMKRQLYCVDEEYGTLLWKVDIKPIAEQFKQLNKAAGAVKYPIIKGNTLFLTDPIAIYAFDKNSGRVIWARTGYRTDDVKPQGLSGIKQVTVVDGIYSDPIIVDENIFYGTREMFVSREIRNGHENWQNREIKSYSAFPTFYDQYVFSQSMDFGKNTFTVYCLDALTGKQVWAKIIQKPLKIFPPVIYKQKVYISSSTILYCLDLKTGETLWMKDYGKYITSSPSFTDRSVLFSLDNADLAVIDPDNGTILQNIAIAPQSTPLYVTVRDQLYIAYNKTPDARSYGGVKAVNFSDGTTLWEYQTPFPGGVSQPLASGGILFLPCGNYIYAIGALSYPRVVKGGSGNSGDVTLPNTDPTPVPDKPDNTKTDKREKEIKTRKMELNVTDANNQPVNAVVDVKKYDDNGKLVYSERQNVGKDKKIIVPEGDNVEVLVQADNYVPKKIYVDQKDDKKDVTLDRIEKGKSIVVDNINFEFNKAYLKKESLNIIDNLVAAMKKDRSLTVEVRGYTDNIGDEQYNQKLSERRADSVVEYMIKNGISPERIKGKGLGSKNPIAPNSTPEGRAKNRRTEFLFLN